MLLKERKSYDELISADLKIKSTTESTLQIKCFGWQQCPLKGSKNYNLKKDVSFQTRCPWKEPFKQ